MFDIRFFRDSKGKCLVLEALDKLPEKVQAKAYVRIERLAELGNRKGKYTIGKWKTKKDLLILDLTKYFTYDVELNRYFYPEFPSIYDLGRRDKIFAYSFILKFASDISKKIEKDGMENIDYIPTQIVAEYFKKIESINNRYLDGICYYSSINGGKNYALFIEQNDCLKKERKIQKLELVEYYEIIKTNS